MAVYEVALFYPGLSYDEYRGFLASVAAGPKPGLQGFRQHGTGVVLTFVVETELGIEFAVRFATQRAAGLWPNFSPGSTTLHVLPVSPGP